MLSRVLYATRLPVGQCYRSAVSSFIRRISSAQFRQSTTQHHVKQRSVVRHAVERFDYRLRSQNCLRMSIRWRSVYMDTLACWFESTSIYLSSACITAFSDNIAAVCISVLLTFTAMDMCTCAHTLQMYMALSKSSAPAIRVRTLQTIGNRQPDAASHWLVVAFAGFQPLLFHSPFLQVLYV